MEKSLGLVEVIGLSSAIEVSDAMVKAAAVELSDVEITKGAGMVTVKIQGNVGSVMAAVAAGRAVALEYGVLVSCHVIPRPLASTGIIFTTPPSQGAVTQVPASEAAKPEPEIPELNIGAESVGAEPVTIYTVEEEPEENKKPEEKTETLSSETKSEVVEKADLGTEKAVPKFKAKVKRSKK